MKPRTLSPVVLLLLLGAGTGATLDALLNLGDTFRGEISHADDIDVIEFDAVRNTRLTISARADKKQILLPQIELIDLTTDKSVLTSASGKKRTVIKKLELPSTGRYRLCITGLEATTGTYTVKTKGKITKIVKRTVLVEEAVQANDTFSVVFDASEQMTLNAQLGKFKKSGAQARFPRLDGPGEAPILLTGFFTDKKDKVLIKNLILPELGTYILTVDNVGNTGDMKAKVKLKPAKITKTTMDEPAEP